MALKDILRNKYINYNKYFHRYVYNHSICASYNSFINIKSVFMSIVDTIKPLGYQTGQIVDTFSLLENRNTNLKFNELEGYLLKDNEFYSTLFYCRECKTYSAPKFVLGFENSSSKIHNGASFRYDNKIDKIVCGHCGKEVDANKVIRSSGSYPVGINMIDNDDKIDISVLYANVSFYNNHVKFTKDKAKLIFNKKTRNIIVRNSSKENWKNCNYSYDDLRTFINVYAYPFYKELLEYALHIYNDYIQKTSHTEVLGQQIITTLNKLMAVPDIKNLNNDQVDSLLKRIANIYCSVVSYFRFPYSNYNETRFLRYVYPAEFKRIAGMSKEEFENYYISNVKSMPKRFRKASFLDIKYYFIYKKLHNKINNDVLFNIAYELSTNFADYYYRDVINLIKKLSNSKLISSVIDSKKIFLALKDSKKYSLHYLLDAIDGIYELHKEFGYDKEQIKRLCVGNVKEIHDNVSNEIGVLRAKKNNEIIAYSYNEKVLECAIDEYKFFLPEDTFKLYDIGQEMNICVGTLYRNRALSKLCTIVAVTDVNNRYVACIELRKSSIVQAKGYRNSKLSGNVLEAVLKWADKNKLMISTNDLPCSKEDNCENLAEHEMDFELLA